MAQWYCHIAGQRHGPMSEEQLRAWAQNGTLKREDHVWCEGMAEWASAHTIPNLFPAAPAAQAPPSPYMQTPVSPYMQARPSPYMGGPSQFVKPHRSGAVLTLGIIGLVTALCCPLAGLICSIIAWVMGSKDMNQMAMGQMDPSGMGKTRGGKICGIIGVVVSVVNGILGAMMALQNQ